MTTIAYNHKDKEVVWDSRTTNGGLIVSDNSQKMTTSKGVKFWICGSACDEELLVDMYFGAKSEVIPECNALVLDGGVIYLFGVNNECIAWKQPLDNDRCLGSGGDFAISAMKLGLSARDSVKHAAKLDCYTGGRIRVHKIKD